MKKKLLKLESTVKQLEYDTNKYDENKIFKLQFKDIEGDAVLVRRIRKTVATFISDTIFFEKNVEERTSKYEKSCKSKAYIKAVLTVCDFNHNICINGLKKLEMLINSYDNKTQIIVLDKKTIEELDNEYWKRRNKLMLHIGDE